MVEEKETLTEIWFSSPQTVYDFLQKQPVMEAVSHAVEIYVELQKRSQTCADQFKHEIDKIFY